MKKIYIGLLALSLTGMLAACGTSSDDGYVIKEGDPVVTEQLMQNNYKNNEVEKNVTLEAAKVELPEGYTLYGRSTSQGYAIVEKDGKFGVYSYFAGKLIIDARLKAADILKWGYDVQYGFLLKYKETEGVWRLIDGVGNILYEERHDFNFADYNAVVYKTNTDEKTKEQTLYSLLTINDSNFVDPIRVFFSYDEKNVANKVKYEEYAQIDYKQGETADSKYAYIDFSQEGLDAKVTYYGTGAGGQVVYVYNSNNTLMGKFDTYRNANIVPIGTKLYVQHVTGSDGMYQLEGKIINLETMKEEKLDLSALIYQAKTLKAAEGQAETYYAVSLVEYKDGRVGSSRTMIMDKEGEFHDDITNKDFVNSYRLTNGYFYNSYLEILYDASFNPVMHTENFYFNRDYEIFCEDVNGGYALINNEGKYIFDTQYIASDVYPTFNKIIGGTDFSKGQIEYLNVADGSHFSLSKDSGKGESSVVDTVEGALIQRVSKTYKVDEEDVRTSEELDKRSASLKTLDGTALLNVEEKFESAQFDISSFTQWVSVNKESKQFYFVRYAADGENYEYLIHNGLLTAKTIED